MSSGSFYYIVLCKI